MLVWGGNHRSFITIMQVCQYLVEWSLLRVWGSVGDAKDISLSTFYMMELAGHSFFQCLEYGTGVSYWLTWKEHNARTFEDTERAMDLLKSLLTRTLFKWPRIWGFMHCTSLLEFINSVSFSLWSVCICFFCSEFTIVNSFYFSYQ